MSERIPSPFVMPLPALPAGPAGAARRRRGASHWRTLTLAALVLAAAAAPARASETVSTQLSDGHPFSEIYFSSTPPQISPDGDYAVYVQDAVTNGAHELWSVALAGGDPVRLSDVLNSGQSVKFAISPDSNYVVYLVDQDTIGVPELYSVPIGGGARTKLNMNLAPASGRVRDFLISPTSERVYYAADGAAFTVIELWRVDIDGGTSTRLNAEITSSYDIFEYAVGITAGGSERVVYRVGRTVQGEHELWSVPGNGSSATAEKISRSMVPAGGVDSYFQISPNGTRVVYSADATDNGSFNLYSVAIAGGTSTQLNGDPGGADGVEPDFVISSDSSKVVYRSDEGTAGIIELYSASITGGGATKLNSSLPGGGDVLEQAIAPDNLHVVYRADQVSDTVNELFSTLIGGGTPIKLNPTPVTNGDVLDFAISPDSGRVVYHADQNTNDLNELFSVPLTGGAATRLNPTLASGGDVQAFRISASGEFVVFGADQFVDAKDELLRVPIAGGSAETVNGPLGFNGDVVLTYLGKAVFEISPDDLTVVYAADQVTDNEIELFKSTSVVLGPPGPPGLPTAVAGNGQVTVTFPAPGNDGGSPITGYAVTPSPATAGWVDNNAGSTSLTHVVANLTNGTAYTFTVRATNVNGTGDPSAPSAPVTPATVPDAPTGVQATAWHRSAIVTFLPPADDGGSSITGYTVTPSPATPGWEDVDAGSLALTHQVRNLINDSDPYSFTVQATNARGDSDPSDPSNSVTPTCDIFCDDFELNNTLAWSPPPSMSVVKSVTSSGPYSLGATVGYSIVATNTGFVTLTGVTIADPGADLGICSPAQPATLAPGATLTCAASHIVDETDLNSGSYLNTATGDSAETTPVIGSVTVTFPTASVAISKTDGSANEIPGTSVAYTIVVSNAGPDAAPNVTVADDFNAAQLSGCSTTCVAGNGASCTAGPILGDLNDSASLPNGGTVTYTAACHISSGATGTLSNTATATVVGVTDPNLSDNTATDIDTLVRQADLSITNTDGVSLVNAGTDTTYTIVASNAGPSDAPGVVVLDIFPNECASVAWTCSGAGGGSCNAGASGSIYESVNLPVGGSVSFSAACSVSGSAAGTLSNTATAIDSGATDPNPSDNSATDVDVVLGLPS